MHRPAPPTRWTRRGFGTAMASMVGATSAPGWAQTTAAGAEQALPPLGARLQLPSEVLLLDGSGFRSADADGQLVVLYWWASWCPFCALQSPAMEKLWRDHKARGLRMLALSIDKQADDAKAYLAKRGYTFPAAMVTPAMARVLPKPRGLPVTLVRGRDGLVLAAESGQLFAEDVELFARFL